MATGRSHRWLIVAGVGVTLACGYVAVRDVRLADVWAALAAIDIWWLAPALALLGLGVVARAMRWRYLFSRPTRPPLHAAVEAVLIGQLFNNLLPVRAGEAARIVALHRRCGVSRVETLGTVAVERAFDVLGLLLLLLLALPLLPAVTWAGTAVAVSLALLVSLIAAAVTLARYGSRPLRAALRPLARVPFLDSGRVDEMATSLERGLSSLWALGLGGAAAAWTVLAWALTAAAFWCVSLGFDMGLTPIAGLFAAIVVGLSMALPSSPAALGVFEAAAVTALAAYGVSRPLALSYAIVLHALHFFPYTLAGVIALRGQAAVRVHPTDRVAAPATLEPVG